MLNILAARLNLFNNTNTTTDSGLTHEMKTFYDNYLIDNAEPELIHDQFAQKRPIPKNGGKKIEFRKYAPLVKQLTPLTEGVTPNGQKLNTSIIEAEVNQFGGYVELSDWLLLTAIDNNMVEATELLGAQMGRTSDTITREVLAANTNEMYAGAASSFASVAQTDVIKVADVRKAARFLKIQNAKKINGDFVAIIHPDCAHDLMSDPEWQYPKAYDSGDLYEGELGKVAGVRFVETTEAKVWQKNTNRGTAKNTVCNVYATQFLGANAYGITEVSGGGAEMIVKQLGSAGSADPLNQRSTVGWKLNKAAEILVPQYIVTLLSASSFLTTPDNMNN